MIAFVSLAFVLHIGHEGSPPPVNEINVGIVAYEDFDTEYQRLEGLFTAWSRHDPIHRFKLAVGTYGEVLDWLDRGLVDLAVLTPGTFAGLLPDDPEHPPWLHYLATIQIPAARSPLAPDLRRAAEYYDDYRSVCVVAEDSPLRSVEDLYEAIQERRVELLFVHPLSVSGRVAPLEALRCESVTFDSALVRYTYSHSQSMRQLTEASGAEDRVAFVWDDAAGTDPSLADGVRRLPFPTLEAMEIPHDVIVARAGLDDVDQLRRSLLDLPMGQLHYRVAKMPDWRRRYVEVRQWLDRAGAQSARTEGELASLDEIGHRLLQFTRSQPHPVRVALVLSGGGAKCSYQVGAVTAIEQRLARLRREHGAPELDISLVVGTSGGAINALPVAMRIATTDDGARAFRRTWLDLDQRAIVQPSWLIRLNMGLWFALIQTAVVVALVRRFVPEPSRRGRIFAIVYTLLAGSEILIGYLPGTPWKLLGTNHIAHHFWLWLSLGVRTAAWSLFVIGLGALMLEVARARRGRHVLLPQRLTRTVLVGGLLGLPLAQILVVLMFQETLSMGHGMERALAEKFPRLINRHLASRSLEPLDIDGNASSAAKLQAASRQLVNRNLLARDLVITASCLGQTSQELPPDLYFHLSADANGPPPQFGERGISLRDHPEILLDVIMGSGSIYPIFPARKVFGAPRSGEFVELVDGGFAHNSPLEAAVLWGATHIILVEATPRNPLSRGNFLRNAASSFQHLYRQAQLLDARSRGKVVVFTLSPEPPHLCVLDFADNLISASIERGYRDASINPAVARPRFHREMGEPVFR